jgi:hypothetical protein
MFPCPRQEMVESQGEPIRAVLMEHDLGLKNGQPWVSAWPSLCAENLSVSEAASDEPEIGPSIFGELTSFGIRFGGFSGCERWRWELWQQTFNWGRWGMVIISRIECGQEFSELLIVTFCIYYLYAICEAWSCKVWLKQLLSCKVEASKSYYVRMLEGKQYTTARHASILIFNPLWL